MTKRSFDKIMEGVADVHAIAKGDADAGLIHRAADVDVKAIRSRTGLSQDAFAARFGFSAGAVRDWEQGRKPPEGSSRVLLTVIDRETVAVMRALSQDANWTPARSRSAVAAVGHGRRAPLGARERNG